MRIIEILVRPLTSAFIWVFQVISQHAVSGDGTSKSCFTIYTDGNISAATGVSVKQPYMTSDSKWDRFVFRLLVVSKGIRPWEAQQLRSQRTEINL